MAGTIYLLNGPNLNLLGVRQPELYGADTLDNIAARLKAQAQAAGFSLKALQSNHEGQLIDWIQQARQDAVGIIINPAAYSHTSIAILDALCTFDGPVIEVHISDIHAREAFRHHSYVSARADEVIIGQGTKGYAMALEKLMARLA